MAVETLDDVGAADISAAERAQARILELETQVSSLQGERDAAVGLGEQLRVQLGETAAARDAEAATAAELAAQHEAVTAQVSAAQATAAEARAAALAGTQRALLAENVGQVVPELVTGDTVEALEASVETARAAFTQVAEAARAATASQTVPAGAGSARTTSPSAGMSALDMISSGLSTRGGR
jgi:hypothetical protein